MLPTRQPKCPPPRGGGNRGSKASASRRGWARPAQRHPDGVLTYSKRAEKPFTPRRAERHLQAETPVKGHSNLTPSGQ